MKKIMCALILMIGVSFSSFGMFKSKKLLHNVANRYAKNATCLFQQKRCTSSESNERPTFVNKENNERSDKDTTDVIPQSFKTEKTYFSKKTGAAGALAAMGLATIWWLSKQDEETQLKFWKYFHTCVQKIPWALSNCCGVIAGVSAAPLMLLCVDSLLEFGILLVIFEDIAPMICCCAAVALIAGLGWYCGEEWYEYHNRKITDIDDKFCILLGNKKN